MTMTLIHNHVDNTLKMPGVQWGKLTFIKHSTMDKLVVVHVAGHHHWSGRGQPQAYASAQFVVFRYDKKTTTKAQTTYDVHYPGLSFDVRVPK